MKRLLFFCVFPSLCRCTGTGSAKTNTEAATPATLRGMIKILGGDFTMGTDAMAGAAT